MKNIICLIPKYSKHILFILILIVFSSNVYSDEQVASANKTYLYKNENYYFSIELPNDWKSKEIADTSSILRLFSISPSSKQSLSIYVLESKDDIDIEKFVDIYSQFFKNLGKLVDTKRERKYWVLIKDIEKTYQSNSDITKLLFQTDNHFGYIILWKSTISDDANYVQVIKSFNVNIPFSVTAGNWIEDELGSFGYWVIGIILILLLGGSLYAIGFTGLLIRRGFILRKSLNIAKIDAMKSNKALNEDWYRYKKKSMYWIILPVLGWIIVYLFLFRMINMKAFLISLIGLIPVILGYYGIVLGPSKDVEDYI